jgi:glycosyltransferase involved in cell wall biosynthesis
MVVLRHAKAREGERAVRILLVISEAPPIKSGIARVADKLSGGLNSHGHQVDILSLQDIPRVERGEIRLSSMPFRLSELKDRFHSYDLIHLHGPVPTFSDVFLLWGLHDLNHPRPKLVYTHHAPIDLHNFLLPAVWLYNRVQERMAVLADHVVATTPSYGQMLSHHVPPHKLSVIPWGVDYERFAAPVRKGGPFTVVYLGQIRPYKGLPVLLNAAAGVEDMRVWVIGDGHYAQECRQKAESLGLRGVTFWGALPDEKMIALLKQAHAIVLPSVTHSEAFGIALLEGMAAGCVPVASYLPGVADIVGNEGFTFPAGNARALAEVLTRLRDDVPLRIHLAGLAQAKARLYSWSRSIFNYERVYSRVVTAKLDSMRAYLPADITQPAIEHKAIQ